MKVFHVCFTLLFLTGCVLDQKHADSQANPVVQQAPSVTVSVPPNQTVDAAGIRQGVKDDIRTELQSSNNTTQNQLSGLMNASVSKLAERITGLESSINASLQMTASADLKMQLQASMSAVVDLKAEIKNTANLTAKMDTVATAVANISTKIGEIRTSLDATVAGQAGLSNSISKVAEDFKGTAGRDVNFLPREAVDAMISNNRMTAYVLDGVFGLLALLALYGYRMARQREQNTNSLLRQALLHVPPDKAALIHIPA